MKRLEKQLKSALYNGMALARWGTLSPTEVRPYRSAGVISFNPGDPRARKKLIHDTLRRNIPRNRAFWNRAVTELEPDTAIDVGVNYGECLFTSRYPDNARALGFEANPNLKPYLDKSLAAHPQSRQLSLHLGLAGSEHGGDAAFHVDTQWSGSSSAVQYIEDDPSRYDTIRVPTISIDGVLEDQGIEPDKLVFKIDVEGYESFVLGGMNKLLERVTWGIGLIEINAVSAKAAGIDMAEYYQGLQERFSIWGFDRKARLVDLRGKGLDTLTAICQKDRPGAKPRPIGTDLVLVVGEPTQAIERLITSWN